MATKELTQLDGFADNALLSVNGTDLDFTAPVDLPVSTLQAAADAAATNAAITAVRNGVATAGNDLAKLYAILLTHATNITSNATQGTANAAAIATINAIIGGTTADGDSLVDTVTELLQVFSTFPEGVDVLQSLNSKQQTLVSGTNIKTVNGASLLGSGDIPIAVSTSVTQKQAQGYINNPSSLAVDGIYIPKFKSLGVSGGAGLAIHASGGIVAASDGAYGTGSLYLPRPIDVSKPFRGAVLIEINDAQETSIYFESASGDASRAFYASVSTLNVGLVRGAYNVVMNAGSGGGGGVPVGTKVWVCIAGDGKQITLSMIPDGATGFVPYGGPAYGTPFTQTGYSSADSITRTFGGELIYGSNEVDEKNKYCRLGIVTQSTQNRIIGVYWTQGLSSPPDTLLNPPLFLHTTILNDPTAYILTKSTPAQDIIQLMHPNGNPADFGTQFPAPAEFAKLYHANYILCGIGGNGAASQGLTNATVSNWGAPTGLVYRKALSDWVRQNIPNTGKLHLLGFSMGLINALNYHAMYPKDVSSVIGISGVTSLADSYTNFGFASIIQKAYGTWYRCIQAGTGQTPSSSPAYWTQINWGMGAPDDIYFASPYVWRDLYASGTAYAANDIVCVSNAGTVLNYNHASPVLKPSAYQSLPIKLWHGTSDTLIPPTQATELQTAVNAAGGNVQVVNVSGGTHLSANCFDGTAILAFLAGVQY